MPSYALEDGPVSSYSVCLVVCTMFCFSIQLGISWSQMTFIFVPRGRYTNHQPAVEFFCFSLVRTGTNPTESYSAEVITGVSSKQTTWFSLSDRFPRNINGIYLPSGKPTCLLKIAISRGKAHELSMATFKFANYSGCWWQEHDFYFPIQLGISSSQLMNKDIFQRGFGSKPPTR